MRSILSVALFSCLLTAPLAADTFVVTKLADTADGTCDSDCSLREALQAANVTGGMDTVTVPAGSFVVGTELVISDRVELAGAGSSATVLDAAGNDRVLRVATIGAMIRDLTVTGGRIRAGNCCGVTTRGSHDGLGAGLLLQDDAGLTLRRVVVRDNTTLEFIGPGLVAGGGIYVAGGAELHLSDSTVTGNEALGQAVFVTAQGGGIAVADNGSATLVNSTLSGNAASAEGFEPQGQDLGVAAGGSAALSHLSLVGIGTGAAALYNDGSVTTVNSIFFGGCSGSALSTLGGNLEALANTCGLTDATDQVAVPAAAVALGALVDNGGPTPTHAPSARSAAIEGALLSACPATDQRGIARPIDADENTVADCDVGAIELVPGIFADGFESGDATGWSAVG